jgi:hypothetical protein
MSTSFTNLEDSYKNWRQVRIDGGLRLAEDGDHVDDQDSHFAPLRDQAKDADAEERPSEGTGPEPPEGRRPTVGRFGSSRFFLEMFSEMRFKLYLSLCVILSSFIHWSRFLISLKMCHPFLTLQ